LLTREDEAELSLPSIVREPDGRSEVRENLRSPSAHPRAHVDGGDALAKADGELIWRSGMTRPLRHDSSELELRLERDRQRECVAQAVAEGIGRGTTRAEPGPARRRRLAQGQEDEQEVLARLEVSLPRAGHIPAGRAFPYADSGQGHRVKLIASLRLISFGGEKPGSWLQAWIHTC